MTDVMKAVQLHAFGGPENLLYEDTKRPFVGSDDVLVQVHAASLNPPDWYLRDGYRALPPEWRPNPTFPLIPGTDVSGVVAAVGNNVSGFSPGDEVYSMVRFPEGIMSGSGAYADYVSIPSSELALKPRGSHMLRLRVRRCRFLQPGNSLLNQVTTYQIHSSHFCIQRFHWKAGLCW